MPNCIIQHHSPQNHREGKRWSSLFPEAEGLLPLAGSGNLGGSTRVRRGPAGQETHQDGAQDGKHRDVKKCSKRHKLLVTALHLSQSLTKGEEKQRASCPPVRAGASGPRSAPAALHKGRLFRETAPQGHSSPVTPDTSREGTVAVPPRPSMPARRA